MIKSFGMRVSNNMLNFSQLNFVEFTSSRVSASHIFYGRICCFFFLERKKSINSNNDYTK